MQNMYVRKTKKWVKSAKNHPKFYHFAATIINNGVKMYLFSLFNTTMFLFLYGSPSSSLLSVPTESYALKMCPPLYQKKKICVKHHYIVYM